MNRNFVFFFFSSRRRHTRCLSDWSSDVCSSDLAEKYMKKGDRIYVEGRVEYRTWEDREKQTRYVTEVIAREVLLLSSRSGGRGGGEPARAKATAKVTPWGKGESLEAVPEALDEGDD